MNVLHRKLTTAFFATFSFALNALLLAVLPNTVQANQDEQLERLLQVSGTIEQVREWPGITKAGFEQGLRENNRIPEDVVKLMLASADKHLDPEVILLAVRASVGEHVNARSMAFLLDWYNSDTGKRITNAEKASSTAEAYERFTVQMPMLLHNRPRAASARRIDKLVSATDMAMEMQSYTGVALYSAMMTAIAPDRPLDLDSYREMSSLMRTEARKNTEQFVLASLVYSYLAVDDESLREYEKFLAHPTTRRFNMRAFEGIAQGTQQVMTAWSHDIANILRNYLAQQPSAATDAAR